jgi:hypothetical protein
MAFGNKEFSYYTYAPHTNTAGITPPDQSHYPVTFLGEKNSGWYGMQKANSVLQFFAEAILNFEYRAMKYAIKTPLPNGMDYLYGITQDTFERDVTLGVEMLYGSGGMALCTEMYDAENEQYGYFAVNATDPMYASEAKVTLTFTDYKYVQIYQYGQIENLALKDGKVTVNLGTGRSAFIMPF